MLRLSLVALAALISLPLRAASPIDAPTSPQQGGAAAAPPPFSTIYAIQNAQALDQFVENKAVTKRMVDQLVCAVTGHAEVARAWQSLVTPADKVGIKVAAAGGKYFGSHRGIVEAIISGLEQAGVPRSKVVVWDREMDDLRSAGFVKVRGSFDVASVPPITGYDRTALFSAPVLGKLIWGDTLFAEKQSKFGKKALDADQLSSNSFLASVLTKQVTKIINVPVLSDEAGCGVGGAIYNMTVPNIDNWRRFTQTEGDGASGLLDLYADERVGAKVVLTIMDALLAQYAGGPRFDPNYAFPYHTIYASKFPASLDANAFRLIDGWRKQAKLPSIAKRAEWLEDGEGLGLGHFAENKIIIRTLGLE